MNGAAASTCSKLSATSSSCLAARKRSTAWLGDSPASRMIPSALTIAAGTSSGRCTAASDTKHAPSAKSASTARAASSASRVLPTPPGPVSVNSRTDAAAQPLADRGELVLATDRAIRRRRQRAVASAPGDAPAAAVGARGASSAGSWARIASWRSWSSAPGSIPSCSTRTSRAWR